MSSSIIDGRHVTSQPASHGFRAMFHPIGPGCPEIMRLSTRIKRVLNCKDLSRAEKDFIVKALIQGSSRPRASKAQCIMAICAILGLHWDKLLTLIFGVLWDKLTALLELILQMIP